MNAPAVWYRVSGASLFVGDKEDEKGGKGKGETMEGEDEDVIAGI